MEVKQWRKVIGDNEDEGRGLYIPALSSGWGLSRPSSFKNKIWRLNNGDFDNSGFIPEKGRVKAKGNANYPDFD